uniref:Uncharacterized protein n=1 Tax=viral metagenome TaxID=1070528 RepID=A0A6M3X8Q0_9ZZZZ
MREPTDEDYKWATEDWDKNRELHELLGLCWHEFSLGVAEYQYCIHCKKMSVYDFHANPDYAADPRLVLREMMKRADCCDFLLRANVLAGKHTMIGDLIHIDYMIEDTGKLRDAAIEWLKKEAADG